MHVSHTMGRIEALLIEVLATQPWFWEVAGRRVAVFTVDNGVLAPTATVHTRVPGSVTIVVDHAPDLEPPMPAFGSVELVTFSPNRAGLGHQLRMYNRPNSGSARHGRKPRNRRRRGGVREVAA